MRSRVLSARPCARVIRRLPEFLGCGLVGFLVWDRLRWFRTAGRSEDFLGCRVGDASGEGLEGAAGATWGADTLEEGGHDVLGDALHRQDVTVDVSIPSRCPIMVGPIGLRFF
jgi:hypothetical protein